MRDITSKQTTLRYARAMAIVWCSENTWTLVKEQKLPKGNVFEFAKASGFMGAKQTINLIPHCHPVSIDGLEIKFRLIAPNDDVEGLDGPADRYGIHILSEAKTIGRTGIEMEALTAASTASLTTYDLLKYLADSSLEISHIKLLEKRGGKSDRERMVSSKMSAAALICSDDVYNGHKEPQVFEVLRVALEKHKTDLYHTETLPSGEPALKRALDFLVEEEAPFVFVSGGTGIRPKDATANVLKEYCDTELPGVAEAMRSFGQIRTPLAMLSRTYAGIKNNTVIIAIPGSTNGAKESLDGILPGLFKAHWMLKKIDRSDA